jgi:hypothetical protein
MHRSLLAAVGVLAFAAACSDPTTGPSAVSVIPSFIAGPTPDVGPIQITLNSGVDATDFCSKTADNTFSAAIGGCGAPSAAPITTLNPGWTAVIPGSSWISWVSFGDRYLSPPASYTYRTTFTVDANATSPVLNVEVAADNGVTVYLNGVQIGATAIDQNIFADVQTYSANSGFNIGGSNELVFVVENTRVPSLITGLPTALGVACPSRPHAKNTANTGVFYDEDPAYDAIACYNPTGLLYEATVSWAPAVIGQGCSPGYWKNHAAPAGYSKNVLFSSIFDNAFPGLTLQQVLNLQGGGLNALGRQTVSAYFNSIAVAGYEMTTAQVIAAFNAAYPGSDYTTLKNTFEALTDIYPRICPLN